MNGRTIHVRAWKYDVKGFGNVTVPVFLLDTDLAENSEWDRTLTHYLPDYVIDAVAEQELRELERRERAYRDDRPAPDVQGRTIILVDNGMATGSTMKAAVEALRQLEAGRVVVATPTVAFSN